MSDFDDMIPEYVTESTELLAEVEGGFLALEEGTAEEDTVHTIFRAIHSIKGGAGFVGLTKIERLAHKMEDLLGLIRNHDMEATPQVTDALLKAMDVLRALFDNVDDMASIDIEPSLAALIAVLEGTNESTRAAATTQALPQDVSGLPTFDVSVYTLKNALQQGNVFYLKLDLAGLERRGITPMELVSELLSIGEILDSVFNFPSEDIDYEDIDLSVDVLYATVLESDLLAAALHLEEGEYRTLTAKDFELSGDDDSAIAMPVNPMVAAQPARPAPAPQATRPAPAARPPQPAAPAAPQAPAPEAEDREYAELKPKTWEDKDYLTFCLEGEIYAVDILRVQEIIGVPHMARLPRSRKEVMGVMNLRGMVVPVFDLRVRLNLRIDPEGPSVVVVMRLGEKIMGGIVDEVRDVLHIKGKDVQEAPSFVPVDTEDGGATRAFCLEGLTEQGKETIIILDVDKVFASGEV